MQSPKIPAFHFNTRFLVTGESWFGGGADMTPTILNSQDTSFFTKKWKKPAILSVKIIIPTLKKNCDEYFYLPHRQEPRGVGGIFFDYMNTEDWNADFEFVKSVE